VHDDHCQPLAADLGGLPMTMAQYEAGCARGRAFHLDELSFRFRQSINARQEIADDGLQMSIA